MLVAKNVIMYLDCCNIGCHMCTQRDQRDAKKGYCAEGETRGLEAKMAENSKRRKRKIKQSEHIALLK